MKSNSNIINILWLSEEPEMRGEQLEALSNYIRTRTGSEKFCITHNKTGTDLGIDFVAIDETSHTSRLKASYDYPNIPVLYYLNSAQPEWKEFLNT